MKFPPAKQKLIAFTESIKICTEIDFVSFYLLMSGEQGKLWHFLPFSRFRLAVELPLPIAEFTFLDRTFFLHPLKHFQMSSSLLFESFTFVPLGKLQQEGKKFSINGKDINSDSGTSLNPFSISLIWLLRTSTISQHFFQHLFLMHRRFPPEKWLIRHESQQHVLQRSLVLFSPSYTNFYFPLSICVFSPFILTKL